MSFLSDAVNEINPILRAILFVGFSFVLSLIFSLLVQKLGLMLEAYAEENKRTVHHGKIVRIGGLAIYFAFLISLMIFFKSDKTINAILVGSFIIFITGFIDDLYNLKPLVKFGLQIIAAVYVVLVGNIQLDMVHMFTFDINVSFISIFISIFWIVGVTNAINLIDGLDGLSCGISSIVICVIGFIAYLTRRIDLTVLSLFLLGSILGVLPFNFYPAKMFVGDCGALFMGFMIACLSILGFKSSTFITLGFPVMMLSVPITDTLVAILRRVIKGQSVGEADKSHVHHILMYKIGFSHRNTVILLYIVTGLFAADAILTFYYEDIGLIILAILIFCMWMFIELTGMINPKFHPIISCVRAIFKHPVKSDSAFFEANKINHREDNK